MIDRATVVACTLPFAFMTPAGAQMVEVTEAFCPGCTIDIQQSARIGDLDGDGALMGAPLAVVRSASGHYWLLHSGQPPMVFDRQGRFIAEVGRRGAGPGEFQHVTAIAALPAGSWPGRGIPSRSSVSRPPTRSRRIR